MKVKLHIGTFLILGLLLSGSLNAQKEHAGATGMTRILFVFDASQSMYARWESGQKVDVAERLLTKMLDSLQSLKSDKFEVALRVYGHQKPVPPQDCNDTRLEVGFSPDNFAQIKQRLRSLSPKGTTPIARSIQRAADDFPECSNCRNIIILLTDGVEACDEDPCAASRLLQQQGIVLKPFVIGIGLDEHFRESFSCVGNFYDAADEKTFENVLGIVISQTLNNTTAQVNLMDVNGLPRETDVPISFYNQVSQKTEFQMVHTLNFKGEPDTIYLDPLITYSMTVHSIPEKHLDSITLSAGSHNHVGTRLPRGDLKLDIPSRYGYDHLEALIRKSGDKDILHVQEFNTSEKYLEGSYDLEILCLPRIYMEDVEISGNKTTKIAIPPPGVAHVQASTPGYGALLEVKENRDRWIANLDDDKARQSFTLQPGRYKIIYRAQNSRKSLYTITQSFSVSSGSSTTVKLK